MLKVEHLKKTYPKSDRVAVDDISFELRPGEIFGFLGQNGAGKSTTIKCLTGILPFDSGTITICGHDIVKEPIKAKMEMGYVPTTTPFTSVLRAGNTSTTLPTSTKSPLSCERKE